MKRVLLITYYWPPSGGSGVQRCLKFVKYLRHYGWEPVVLTVSNPDYPVFDASLEQDIPAFMEVLKVPAWEPYTLYRLFTGSGARKTNIGFVDSELKENYLERLSLWIRGNLFIPDARMFWIRPSVKFLETYLQKNPVDMIFSSGPPHSAHLIAKKIKKSFDLPWVADFRDPWTGVYYYHKMKVSAWADRRHRKMERECLDAADHLVTVNSFIKEDFSRLSSTTVEVIPNGYDPDDFAAVNSKPGKRFIIAYTGMFLRDQDAPELWEVLREMTEQISGFRENLKLVFAGKVDQKILEGIKRNQLDEFLELQDYVPHSELPSILKGSSLLLLSINRTKQSGSITTGKIFEYLASERPILAFCSPGSDAEQIITATNSGFVLGFNQKDDLRQLLEKLYQQHLDGTLKKQTENIEVYSRKELTHCLAAIFDSLTETKK
jgi:glycosyltransferase involved in cell wall biosynthesis